MTLFDFVWLTRVMAKKSNHRGRGGHRALLFSPCPLCALWFSEPIPGDNKKSHKNGHDMEYQTIASKNIFN